MIGTTKTGSCRCSACRSHRERAVRPKPLRDAIGHPGLQQFAMCGMVLNVVIAQRIVNIGADQESEAQEIFDWHVEQMLHIAIDRIAEARKVGFRGHDFLRRGLRKGQEQSR